MDYDESIRVMTEFISHHPIAVQLMKTPNPQLPLQILHTAFERIKIEDDVLDTKITGDMIVLVNKQTFLKAIGIPKNPKGFQVHEPTSEEFQTL